MLLSDKILAANETVLNDMLTHRFVTDICTDQLDQSVFHRYLAYEGQFVETAISIFAHAVACAPDITAQRWLIGVLDALANTQVAYFEEVLARLDIPLMPQDQSGFGTGMLDIASKGNLVDILTAMFAAEWMYWTWCRTAAAGNISDPDLLAWVDLHAEPEFAAQALWLKQAIDTYGDERDAERLCAIFDRVTRLEIAFHSAAYDVPSLDQGPSQ